MIQRFGEPIQRNQRYKRRPGVYAVLLNKGQILTTHQADPVPEYQLPGGGIDPGEQPIPALHREVMEETGWHIANLRRLGAFRRFCYMAEYDLWAEKVCTVYLARPTLCVGPPSEPGHHAVWLAPNDALGLLGSDGDRAMLRFALNLL